MKPAVLLSVALATRNEEENIARCLRSVVNFADEIVIADAHSTDATRSIAKEFHARVLDVEHVSMFHINKQIALDACVGKWILSLDADEVVSDELKDQILQIIKEDRPIKLKPADARLFARHEKVAEKKNDVQYKHPAGTVADGYFLPRLNFFLGGYLRHGGVYPDGVIRLTRKNKASFPCKDVHEQMAVNGTIAWLSGPLIHYSDPTVKRYWQRANRYTSATAGQFKDQKVSKNVQSFMRYFFTQPMRIFLSLFVRHKGFLDGIPGFFWSVFSALHYPIAYLKYLGTQ